MFRSPTFTLLLLFAGLPLVPGDDRVKGSTTAAPASDDLAQVKRIIAARQEYQTSLEELRAHYIRLGDLERVRWVEDELLSFHRISKRAYRLDLDAPPPTLTP